MRVLQAAVAGLCLASLAACAPLRPPLDSTSTPAIEAAWQQRQKALGDTRGFQALGRVAVKGGGLSGSLSWQQAGEHFSLRIAGPFGAGALSMEGTPALVSIRGKDLDLTTTDPRTVLAERTGWRLPLEALRWWVLGLPAPGEAHSGLLLDAAGRPEQFEQAGWQLRFTDYAGETAAALPSRIEAQQGEWLAIVLLQSLTLTP